MPETYNGRPVVEIGYAVFSGKNFIKKVTIPQTIATIGGSAFYGSVGLQEVVILGATEIKDSAFRGCTALTKTVLPETLKFIRKAAFYGCYSLRDTVLPSSITSIGEQAFYNCRALLSISLPSGVGDNIEKEAFAGCSSLTVVEISQGARKIGTGVFKNCTSLKTIIIPSTIIAVDVTAFNGCSALTDVLFNGTESEWKAALLSANAAFKNLNVYFYSEQEKYDGKGYWHYNTQGQPVKW